MSILITEGERFNIPLRTYFCDTEEDFNLIPDNAPPYSQVYILSTSSGISKKIKTESGSWVDAPVGGGGGGSYPTNFTTPITVLTPTTDYNPATKKYVDDAISGITEMDYQVVTTLPSAGVKGVIYLIADSHGENDNYDEYLWVGSQFEKIGNTDIDLSGYIPVVTGAAGHVPMFDTDGTLKDTGYTLGKSVPNNAVFTDTTYSNATTAKSGLMSAADKTTLNNLDNTYFRKDEIVVLTQAQYDALTEKTATLYLIMEE